jgi:hypothetical protein
MHLPLFFWPVFDLLCASILGMPAGSIRPSLPQTMIVPPPTPECHPVALSYYAGCHYRAG